MQIQKLLELRSHPEQNKKEVIFEILKKFQESCDKIPNVTKGGEPVSNGFVSFTNLRKLGINPSSGFNTPNAIYSYDIDYVIEMLQDGTILPKNSRIPYAADNPYFNTFVAKNPEKLYVVGRDEEKLQEYIKNTSSNLYEFVYNSPDRLRMKMQQVEGGEMAAVFELIGEFFPTSNKWSHFLRKAGFDGIVDLGYKVIHSNEPRQSLFFNKQVITKEKLEINKADILPSHPDAKLSIHPQLGTKFIPTFISGKFNVSIFDNPDELEVALSKVAGPLLEDGPTGETKRILSNIFSSIDRALPSTGTKEIRILKTLINICKTVSGKITPILQKKYSEHKEVFEKVMSKFDRIISDILFVLEEHLEMVLKINKLRGDIKLASLILKGFQLRVLQKDADGEEADAINKEIGQQLSKFVPWSVERKLLERITSALKYISPGEPIKFNHWYKFFIENFDSAYKAEVDNKIQNIKRSS